MPLSANGNRTVESQLKQRLIGAAVLIALAVIFLPMLVQGPAPDSGVSDVPLDVPAAPRGDGKTVDLPLVMPYAAPTGGALGMPGAPGGTQEGDKDGNLPMVDTTTAIPDGPADAMGDGDASRDAEAPMLPVSVAGGGYAVHFAAYASSVSADTVVSRLRGDKLPAYRETATLDGKPAYRVRIGPYATRADAEIARIEAGRIGKQSGARVVTLDAAQQTSSQPVAAASQAVKASDSAITTEALPPEPSKAATATVPAAAKPAASKPAVSNPEPVPTVTKPVATTTPAAATPAASGVGFAVQIGAFSDGKQAAAKRDELRAAGFSAFTETVDTDKGTLTRVLAGPVVSRDEAEKLKGQVQAKTGAAGMVRSHP